MTIKIEYPWTSAAKHEHFCRTGVYPAAVIHELKIAEPDISPGLRDKCARLEALGSYGGAPTIGTPETDETVLACLERGQRPVRWLGWDGALPSLTLTQNPVDVAPERPAALADFEAWVDRCLDRAGEIKAEGARRRQAVKDAEAAKHAARVAEVRGAGLAGLLARNKQGEWSVSLSTEHEAYALEALGPTALGAARELAAERNRQAVEECLANTRTLVGDHGSTSERARLREGLLPEGELQALFTRVAFAWCPEGTARYARVTEKDIEHSVDCAEPSCECTIEGTDGLNEAEHARFVELREMANMARQHSLPKSLPGATIEGRVRQHRCWCDCEGSPVVLRQGYLVTVTWRTFKASREFAL